MHETRLARNQVQIFLFSGARLVFVPEAYKLTEFILYYCNMFLFVWGGEKRLNPASIIVPLEKFANQNLFPKQNH